MLRTIMILILAISFAGCNLSGNKEKSPANKDKQHSNELLQKAARGDGRAQYAIAYRYYYGIGVPENTNLALEWMRKSKRNGYTLAEKALPVLINADKDAEENPDAEAYHAEPDFIPEGPTNRDYFAGLLKESHNYTHNDFTVSLIESESRASAARFIAEHGLHTADIIAIKQGKKTRYQVVSGEFASVRAARRYIKNLPSDLKQLRPSVIEIQARLQHKRLRNTSPPLPDRSFANTAATHEHMQDLSEQMQQPQALPTTTTNPAQAGYEEPYHVASGETPSNSETSGQVQNSDTAQRSSHPGLQHMMSTVIHVQPHSQDKQ